MRLLALVGPEEGLPGKRQEEGGCVPSSFGSLLMINNWIGMKCELGKFSLLNVLQLSSGSTQQNERPKWR